jgi:RNA polymerase sigma-70 factor (ECF subfamily)
VAPSEDELSEPTEPAVRALLDQYISAFEEADIAALMGVLRDDVALEMPPNPAWFAGRVAVGQFVEANIFAGPHVTRMIRVIANDQPAVAVYWREADGTYHAHAVQVLAITATGISRIVSFNDPGLFPAFALPTTLPPEQNP